MNSEETAKDPEPTGTGKTKNRLAGDTERMNLMKEIGQLSHLKEFEPFLKEALESFKQEHGKKFLEYKNLLKRSKEELGKEVNTDTKRSKSYFFELVRKRRSNGKINHIWDVKNFKFKLDSEILEMIFDPILDKVDRLKIDPDHIHSENVYLKTINKWFEINFIKSGTNNVNGFVRIEGDPVVDENEKCVTISTKTPIHLKKPRLLLFIEQHPEAGEDFFMAAQMMDSAMGSSLLQD